MKGKKEEKVIACREEKTLDPSKHKKLTKEEIEEIMRDVQAIGSHEKNGFIFVVSHEDKPEGIVSVKSIGYVRRMSKANVMSLVAKSLKVSGLEAMLAISQEPTNE